MIASLIVTPAKAGAHRLLYCHKWFLSSESNSDGLLSMGPGLRRENRQVL